MKITIITGSHRDASQSKKVGEYIKKELNKKNITTEIFDLASYELPMVASNQNQDLNLKSNLESLNKHLQESDGIITVSPEWDGMATPLIKNFVQVAGKTISHKPNLIASVSAGRGGAYPIVDLRAFGYKNNKTVYIPDHLIVRGVNDVLNDDIATEKGDIYIRDRIDWSLDVLIEYAKVLKPLREKNKNLLYNENYGNGM